MINSFVHNNDIISRCSHTQILSLVSALVAVDGMKWGALERAGMLLRNTLTADEERAIHDALLHRRHFMEGNDKELYIPGDIYVLKPYSPKPAKNITTDRGVDTKVKNETAVGGISQNSPSSSATKAELHTQGKSETPDNNVADSAVVSSTSEKGDSSSSRVEEKSAASIVTAAVAATASAITTTTTTTTTTSGTSSAAASSDPLLDFYTQTITALQIPADAFNFAQRIDSEKSMNHYRKKNNLPGVVPNQTDTSTSTEQLVSPYYQCVKVTDPRVLFNGLMYYGDGMVNDHLTAPFERALLLLSSVNKE